MTGEREQNRLCFPTSILNMNKEKVMSEKKKPVCQPVLFA